MRSLKVNCFKILAAKASGAAPFRALHQKRNFPWKSANLTTKSKCFRSFTQKQFGLLGSSINHTFVNVFFHNLLSLLGYLLQVIVRRRLINKIAEFYLTTTRSIVGVVSYILFAYQSLKCQIICSQPLRCIILRPNSKS